jgi:hypothetical protein
MGKIVMGYWTCPICGTTGIEGPEETCPNCGSGKDKSVKYYMDPNNPIYLDDYKNVGPDWYCSYCGNANKNDITSCVFCGANKKEQSGNYFEVTGLKQDCEFTENEYIEEEQKLDDSIKEPEDYGALADETNLGSDSLFNFKKVFSWLGPVALVGLAIIAFIFLIIPIFQPKRQNLSIEDYSWTREVRVESLQNVSENGWYVPAGGEVEYTRNEIHHYDDVFDHNETRTRTYNETILIGYDEVITGYSDNGNGTFTELTTSVPKYQTITKTETYLEPIYIQVPVYETKYYYNIDKWLYSHSLKSKGINTNPYWNDTELEELEKIIDKKESYKIHTINKKGKEKTYELKYDIWNKLRIENIREINVSIDVFGNITLEE